MAPTTVDALRAEIIGRHDGLSKRLQQIGRFILDHPNEVALETLAVIAARCGVQPSAIVRFAKTFHFDGASQMQKLLRDSLLSNDTALGYGERIRSLQNAAPGSDASLTASLSEFVESNRLSLANLLETASEDDMESAVRAIVRADTVYVVGFRRSFPVASYLSYSLMQAGKRVVFIDGVGGLAMQQVHAMKSDDLLIAISFQPYATDTVAVVEASVKRCTILAITDTVVSPIAKKARISLTVRESDVRGFRSLSASICLAQVLVINFALEAAASGKSAQKLRPPRK